MTNQTLALLFLATALLVAPGAAVSRLRLAAVMAHRPPTPSRAPQRALPVFAAVSVGTLAATVAHLLIALPVSVAAWFAARRLLRESTPAPDPLRLAAGWDLLSACLRAGLPVPAAVRAIAGRIPGDGGQALRATADLLALGADAADAWKPAAVVPATAQLARGARRTARSGTELAAVASALAAEVRAGASDLSEARAQRAGVLITGPLGLCFLPAFVCLGIVPVITGLAGRLGLAG